MSTTQRRCILSRKCPKIVFVVGGNFELRNSVFDVLEKKVKGLEVRGTVQVKSLEDLIGRIEVSLPQRSPFSEAIGVVVAEPLDGCFSGMSADLLAQELGDKLEDGVKKATIIVVVDASATPETILQKLQGD